MPRMSDKDENSRARLENSLAALAGARRRIGLIGLRMAQAERRSGLHDLIEPAINDLNAVDRKLRTAQAELSELWQTNWNKKDHPGGGGQEESGGLLPLHYTAKTEEK